jgi:hypothetical protein
MWSFDSSVVLYLIPIVFVGIIIVAAIGSQDEKSRGDKIAKFFSIAANAALAFTVLGLLYQVIDSAERTRNESYAEVLDTYYQISQLQIERPEIWDRIYPAEAEVNPRTEEESLALQYTYFIMNFFQRIYLLYSDGEIERELWAAWENWIRYSMTTSPLFQAEWNESCGIFHPDFVDYIEENYDDGVCLAATGQVGGATGTPEVAAVR